jgi:SAM-dependent methyltransferase
MLARQTSADTARSRFVLALKRHLVGQIRAKNGLAYEVEGAPRFEAHHGRVPATREDALEALRATRHYRTWSALNRTSQEMMWQTVAESIHRDRDRLEAKAAALAEARPAGGSLNLHPELEPDPLYSEVDIHLQPSSYVPADPDGRSVLAGSFYEMGGRIYSMGRGMAASDSKAECVLRYLAETRPGWSPRRILDMGCSAGSASVPYAEAFPDAEVHAIDLGSSMLRYAHARAEALGYAVHFHQMDAGRTLFPDGHFDLVISHNLFHEISSEKRREVAAETRRLVAPGGIAVHQDVDLLFRGKAPWQEAERAWDYDYNNEPFWVAYAECDFRAELIEAGFRPEQVSERRLAKTAGPGYWYVFCAEQGPSDAARAVA